MITFRVLHHTSVTSKKRNVLYPWLPECHRLPGRVPPFRAGKIGRNPKGKDRIPVPSIFRWRLLLVSGRVLLGDHHLLSMKPLWKIGEILHAGARFLPSTVVATRLSHLYSTSTLSYGVSNPFNGYIRPLLLG